MIYLLPLGSLLIWLAFSAVLPAQASERDADQIAPGRPNQADVDQKYSRSFRPALSNENFSAGYLAEPPLQTDDPVFPAAYLPIIFKPPLRPPLDPTPRDRLYCSNLWEPLDIPDGNPAGTTDTLLIDNWRFIRDLDVYLDIEHNRVGDLHLSLIHLETGIQVTLLDRPGFPERDYGCGGSNLVSIFDDEATQPAEDKCAGRNPAISGSFQSETPLRAYEGAALSGQWILNVSDNEAGGAGLLKGWCLDVTLQETIPEPIQITPPELPSEAWVGGLNGQNQAMPLDCESRSAVDWARYFGTWIDEFDFFSQLPVSDNPDTGFVGSVWDFWGQIPPQSYGVHAQPVANLLQEYGLPAYAHRNLSWADLRAEIAAGRPAITWVIGKSDGNPPGAYYPFYYTPSDGRTTVVSPYEHTVLVFGYNHESVWILDGALVYTRRLDQFFDSWSVLRNMAVLSHP